MANTVVIAGAISEIDKILDKAKDDILKVLTDRGITGASVESPLGTMVKAVTGRLKQAKVDLEIGLVEIAITAKRPLGSSAHNLPRF